MSRRFPPRVAATFAATGYLYIRSGDHRFIAVWVVVVEGRVFVRSWNDKPGGWYRAFLRQPRGAVKVGDREVPVRAVRPRSPRLVAAATDAYARKYLTPANVKYVRGFRTPTRVATTLELVPAR